MVLTGGATARWIATDYTGESKASEVEAKSIMIILPQELGVHLADAVDGAWSLNRDVRRRISGRVRTERSDRRRDKDPQLVLLRQLDDVVHSCSG